MTRLQEIQWLDETVDHGLPLHAAKAKNFAGKVDLFHTPWLRPWIESRWPQLSMQILMLFGYVFTIVTAITGTLVGSHNFAIIGVWVAWWTALKLGFIPLGGRSWCSICPIPLVGDWVQNGGIVHQAGPRFGLNLRWPKVLRGGWLQSATFLLIGLFSAVTLTSPRITGWVLLALVALATVMTLVFKHHPFCRYICPIGGISGMYARAAPVEVRPIAKAICSGHLEKTCYQACPSGLYPLALKDSSECSLCLECLRACPKDNLALNLRPYGSDLGKKPGSNRLDGAFLALVMLGSALVFSAVFLGPWEWLKSAAYDIGSSRWFIFVALFLAITIIALPAVYSGGIWLWKKMSSSNIPLKQLIAFHSQGLIPLGLLAWIAFTVSFALPKLNLVLSVLNDPFGWGWNWLRLSGISGSLNVSSLGTYLEVLLVMLGVAWASRMTDKLSKMERNRSSLINFPVLSFHLAYSAALLWLLMG